MNLTSVLIGSEDPDRLVAYYTKLLGEPSWNGGGYTGWMIGQGSVTVGPHDQVHGRNGEPGRIIWNIETPDVRSEFERFKGAGATVVQEPYTMEGMDADDAICTLEDPDGNYFQLMSPMGPPED
jgi:predicted enzyme related to lactoylglutathione lyase